MPKLFNELNWSDTPIGPIERWPENLRLMASVILSSQFPMFIAWGPERTFLYNSAYASFLGEKHPTALGQKFEDVWAEIWKELLPFVKKVDRGESAYLEDHRLLMYRNSNQQLEETYFTFSYSPITDLNGQVSGLYCACIETTETVQAKKSVEESNQRYRTFMQQTTDGIWRFEVDPISVTDPVDEQIKKVLSHGWLAECNDAMAKMYGFEKSEDLIGARLSDLLKPDDPKNTDYLKAFIQSGYKLSDIESIEVDRFGNYKHFSNSLVGIIEDGFIKRAWGSQRDITAEVRAKDEIIKLANAIPQMIYTSDSHGVTTSLNQRWYDYTGAPADSLETIEYIHPDDLAKAQDVWTNAQKNIETYEHELRIKNRFNEYRWFITRSVPRIENGKHVGWFGTSTDIHEQKIQAEQLRLAKEDAERANQLKSAFLANMSHEIRTPLGAMIGFTDLLREPTLSISERGNYLNVLSRNAEQLSLVINDILDLSKVEAGHLTLEFSRFSAADAVNEIVSLLTLKAKEKNISITTEFSPLIKSEIVSDVVKVRQILLNLIGNSLKFTDQGAIHIRIFPGLSASGNNPTVCFEVTDTGVGVDKSQHEKIFDVFVQADNSTTRRFGGTGLGLPLSRKLAKALGGDVILRRSEPGQGSTFLFTIEDKSSEKLNLKNESFKESFQKLQPAKDALKGMYILIVDDSLDNQELISTYLMKFGAAVDLAENGLEGYKKALGHNYDLVLMDLQMPEMDGYTATHQLRSLGYNKPIVALSAHAMTEIRTKCLNVGCTAHLAKPINPQDLISTISNLVPVKN